MAPTQSIWACRHFQDDLLKLKPSMRMVKKGDSSEFEGAKVVGARWGSLSLETVDLNFK